jgi:hypothetical protein
MCTLMACWAQYDEVTRVITIKWIADYMHGMQLQSLVVFPAFRTSIVSLFTERSLQGIHLCHMHNIEADVKKKAS